VHSKALQCVNKDVASGHVTVLIILTNLLCSAAVVLVKGVADIRSQNRL
jgi:hypothetical protein